MAGKKIKIDAVIKSVNTKAGGTSLSFEKIDFPTGQSSTLTDWCKGKEQVVVTMQLKQPLLPEADDKGGG